MPNWTIKNSAEATVLRLIDAERIDQIADELPNSVSSWRVRLDLRLPSYAIDQLICLGVVKGSDPVVRLMRGKPCLPKREVEDLISRIRENAMKGGPRNTAVSLRMMSNCIGGKEKPWGAIMKAMTEGKMPYWLKSDDITTHQILIDPQEREAFLALHFDRNDYPHYEFEPNLNTFDVADILNLQPRENVKLREAGIFDACKPKHAFDYDVRDVLAMAKEWVSVTELIRRYDMNDRVVKRQLAAAGVASKLSLWERERAEAECLKWKNGSINPRHAVPA